jgi:hypothetical protein
MLASIDADKISKSRTLAFNFVHPWSVDEIGAGPDLGLGRNDIFAQTEVSYRIFKTFCILFPQDQPATSAPNHPRAFGAAVPQSNHTCACFAMRTMGEKIGSNNFMVCRKIAVSSNVKWGEGLRPVCACGRISGCRDQNCERGQGIF